MQIERYRPSVDHPLAPYVESIWRAQTQHVYVTETILPSTKVDLLFNFGDGIEVLDNPVGRGALDSQTAYVAGLQPISFTNRPQGRVNLLGISFRAEACAALLPLPLAELTGLTVNADCIFANFPRLHEQLGEAAGFAQQCCLLLPWLLSRINPPANAELVRQVCLAFQRSPNETSLTEQATRLHLSTRHLRRLFFQHVGVSPAHYLRLSRFSSALQLMPQHHTLTEIAQEASYFDQAHFCREFKAIAGMTPHQYRARMGIVPGHLFTVDPLP